MFYYQSTARPLFFAIISASSCHLCSGIPGLSRVITEPLSRILTFALLQGKKPTNEKPLLTQAPAAKMTAEKVTKKIVLHTCLLNKKAIDARNNKELFGAIIRNDILPLKKFIAEKLGPASLNNPIRMAEQSYEYLDNIHYLRCPYPQSLAHIFASHKSNFSAWEALLASGIDINNTNHPLGFTPLHSAVFIVNVVRSIEENIVTIDLLLDNGASLEAKDFYGRTPREIIEENILSLSEENPPDKAAYRIEILKQILERLHEKEPRQESPSPLNNMHYINYPSHGNYPLNLLESFDKKISQ